VSESSESSWLAFTPRDTVFVRDGRSFEAAADNSGTSVRPSPTTIAGAIGALFKPKPDRACGEAGAAGAEPDPSVTNPDEVRGPVLARLVGGEWDAYFPAPADLVRTADRGPARVYRLVREEISGTTDLDEAVTDGASPKASWLVPPEDAGRVQPLGDRLIPADRLAAYLAGDLPARSGTALDALRAEDYPFRPEQRVGLAREGRRVRAGYLYQMTHLRSEDGWAFLGEFVFSAGPPRSPAPGPVKFGGRGRLADVAPAALAWPAAPDRTALAIRDGRAARRVLAYLATPALWPGGWRIPVPEGARLVAAACGKPLPAATLAPGPRYRESRALRWAVPAGSVYLLEFDDAAAASRWAAEVHGTACGAADGDLGYMRTAGFGVVLTGVWDD
jgi:CRISPR type III-B/RAMP module-associated protein Cmr3